MSFGWVAVSVKVGKLVVRVDLARAGVVVFFAVGMAKV
jgi:hypothetical protein